MKICQELYQIAEKIEEISYLCDNLSRHGETYNVVTPSITINQIPVKEIRRRIPSTSLDLIQKIDDFRSETKSLEDRTYLMLLENNQLYEIKMKKELDEKGNLRDFHPSLHQVNNSIKTDLLKDF